MDELTQEEIQALKDKAAKADKLEAENKSLKKEAKAAKIAAAPVSFDVDEDDEENDIEKGTYDFTAPTLTWDDGTVVNVRELSASKEKKDMQLFSEICAALVQRKSGLVALRKED